MMEKLYCTIFIVDISQNPEEVDTVSSRIQQLIEDHGGIIKKVNPWGKQKLAYPIQNRTYGFYVEIEFTANSHLNIPKTIEQEYRINDRVLRYLTYVVTKKELKQREINAARMKEGKLKKEKETDNNVQTKNKIEFDNEVAPAKEADKASTTDESKEVSTTDETEEVPTATESKEVTETDEAEKEKEEEVKEPEVEKKVEEESSANEEQTSEETEETKDEAVETSEDKKE
jgi:small subunit ribosomal protein S6